MIATRGVPRSVGSTNLGRMYALVRCFVLLLFTGAALLGGTIDPTFRTVLLVGAVYAILTGLVAWLPAAQPWLPWLYAADIVVGTAVGWFGPGLFANYAPWLVVPLSVAAFHVRRWEVLALSTVAIVAAGVLMFKPGSPPTFSAS